jgi:hypothetical protein
MANSAIETTVTINASMGTSIAADLFPVSVKLTEANLFLTEPSVVFQNPERIGLQLRFQAYDHRPAQGVAISEMGRAKISGKIGYDTQTRQVLLYDPRMDDIIFDNRNPNTARMLAQIQSAWTAQVTNPIRAELPPHPYLIPVRNNIRGVVYDGDKILVNVSYQ